MSPRMSSKESKYIRDCKESKRFRHLVHKAETRHCATLIFIIFQLQTTQTPFQTTSKHTDVTKPGIKACPYFGL